MYEGYKGYVLGYEGYKGYALGYEGYKGIRGIRVQCMRGIRGMH